MYDVYSASSLLDHYHLCGHGGTPTPSITAPGPTLSIIAFFSMKISGQGSPHMFLWFQDPFLLHCNYIFVARIGFSGKQLPRHCRLTLIKLSELVFV